MYDALELWPRFFARIFRSEMQDTAPNISLAVPIATEILALEKPRNLAFCQMAAKTTSGSGFDLKNRLNAPGFLFESGFVAVYLHALGHFSP